MDNNLKEQLDEIKKLHGDTKVEKLLAFAQENESPQAYNELGIYYKDEKNDNLKAVEMFEKALTIQKDAGIYNNLATCYYNLSQPDTPERNRYMDKTVEAFKEAAKLNSAAYYFLGNLYMPKVNPPFPEDREKAVSYFMKIEKNKGYFWQQGMRSIGMYYYEVVRDYITASSYLFLSIRENPMDKKTMNIYQFVFGKVNNRKFWKEQMLKINDQHDVAKIVEEGKKKITLRCPRCGSTKCQRISIWTNMRKHLTVSFGTQRFKNYMAQYQCNSCHHEW